MNKQGAGGFQEEDEAFLEGLSVHAALAIENARLHTSAIEKERYDREVALAQAVQRNLQPESYERTFGSICRTQIAILAGYVGPDPATGAQRGGRESDERA